MGISLPKPGVGRRVHLFLAPLIWTLVGLMLMFRGWGWLGRGNGRFLVILALGLGSLKGRYVLDRSARRCLRRIADFGDYTCVGAVYSWKSWLLVIVMMGFGMTMRTLTEPGPVLGTLYMAIGWGLFFSSRLGWRAWLDDIRG